MFKKVFSIFEEHTEWISKGKAGVPQELGLCVCILEDQHGFILHHHVMEKQKSTPPQPFPNKKSPCIQRLVYSDNLSFLSTHSKNL